MARASMGCTNPEAGVMATRPATAPAAAPTTLGFLLKIQLIRVQVSAAEAAAVLVTTKALAAWPLAAPALPALKPNHPNQRIAAPSTTIVISWGSMGSRPWPIRRPKKMAAARAAAPELMWMAVPPAKSSASMSLGKSKAVSHPSAEKTQWATGLYTRKDHKSMNTRKVLNLA